MKNVFILFFLSFAILCSAQKKILPKKSTVKKTTVKKSVPPKINSDLVKINDSIPALIPQKFDGKNLIELDLRNRYEANVIGIKRKDGKLIVSPKPLVEIESGDMLVVIADTRKIDLLSKIL